MFCLNRLSITTFTSNNQPKSSADSRTNKDLNILSYRRNDGSANATKKAPMLPPNVEKTITSPSNPFVKHCVKLRENSSYRHSHGLVLVVGSTPIREILSCCREWPILVECLLVLESSTLPEDITKYCAQVVRVSSAVIRKVSGIQSVDSVDIIALMRIPSTFHNISNDDACDNDRPTWFPSPHRILVLDGIQDPGNLGSLLRSATAFRWGGVFLLPGCCDPFNDKALRACRGACFQIPIVSGKWNHVKALQEEHQMKLFAGHPTSDGVQDRIFTLSNDFADSVSSVPLCLVLGSEGAGLSEYSRNVCELVTIQMPGDFESLNVSVAGGIFMYMLQPRNDAIV